MFCFLVLQNKAVISRVTNLSDTVVGLESFTGSGRETNPLYKDYHGKQHLYNGKRVPWVAFRVTWKHCIRSQYLLSSSKNFIL